MPKKAKPLDQADVIEQEDPAEEVPADPTEEGFKLLSASVSLDNPSSFLNVRAEPSISAACVGQLYQGDEVTVLEIVDSWCRIGDGQYVSAIKLMPR